jgi:hypothetical protein
VGIDQADFWNAIEHGHLFAHRPQPDHVPRVRGVRPCSATRLLRSRGVKSGP